MRFYYQFFARSTLLLAVQFSTAQTRTHQNFDRDWKFSLGYAADPAKDFNYRVETIFSKSGMARKTAIESRRFWPLSIFSAVTVFFR